SPCEKNTAGPYRRASAAFGALLNNSALVATLPPAWETSMNFNLKGGLAVLSLLAFVAPAAAQTVEFTLINNSSQALHYFYTNPSNMDAWGEDLLGEDGTLEAGEQGVVTIGDGSDQCVYDFRFE